MPSHSADNLILRIRCKFALKQHIIIDLLLFDCARFDIYRIALLYDFSRTRQTPAAGRMVRAAPFIGGRGSGESSPGGSSTHANSTPSTAHFPVGLRLEESLFRQSATRSAPAAAGGAATVAKALMATEWRRSSLAAAEAFGGRSSSTGGSLCRWASSLAAAFMTSRVRAGLLHRLPSVRQCNQVIGSRFSNESMS